MSEANETVQRPRFADGERSHDQELSHLVRCKRYDGGQGAYWMPQEKGYKVCHDPAILYIPVSV